MADAAGAHLGDEEAGRRGDAATVSGTPISPLSELTGATVSATDDEHGGEQVLGRGLARRAGDADDAKLGGPVDDAARDPPKAVWTSSTSTHGTPSTGREASAATAPARDRRRDEVVAVGVLADPGDVEAARAAVARVGRDGAVDDDVVGCRRCRGPAHL